MPEHFSDHVSFTSDSKKIKKDSDFLFLQEVKGENKEKIMKEITLKISIPEKFENFINSFLATAQAAPKTTQTNDEIWTVKDLCSELKIPKSKIYSMTMYTGAGCLPRYKVGRTLRFKKDEVIQWFESQRVA